MTQGRPTDYSDKVLDQTREYIDLCEDEDKKVKIPTIEGLAVHLGVNKSTVYLWRKLHTPFSDLIEDLLARQGDRLVNKGLSGDYNPTIAKVLLTKHGYREGHEHTGADGDPLFDAEAKEKGKQAITEYLGNTGTRE